MALTDRIKALATRVGQEIKAVRSELNTQVQGLNTLLNGKANETHTHNASAITAGVLSDARLPVASYVKTGVTQAATAVQVAAGVDSPELYINPATAQTALMQMNKFEMPWAWNGAAGALLTTPTYEGSGQVTHPSVLKLTTPIGGYTWWMAMTPYPQAKEGLENPSVLASNDGITWVVPAGLTNPLDTQNGAPNPHNSDAHMTLGPDGQLVMTWRTTDRPNGSRNSYAWRTSTNGVNWTAKQVIFQAPVGQQIVSPSLRWTGSKWDMWVVNASEGYALQRFSTTVRSPTISTVWTKSRCNLSQDAGPVRRWWHADVSYYDGVYYCLMMDRGVGSGNNWSGSDTDGDLFLFTSSDGTNWTVSGAPLLKPDPDPATTRYKSCFVMDQGRMVVYYSTFNRNTSDEWRIRRALAYMPTSAAEFANRAIESSKRNEYVVEWMPYNRTAGLDYSGLRGTVDMKTGTVILTGVISKTSAFGVNPQPFGNIPDGLRPSYDIHIPALPGSGSASRRASIGYGDGTFRAWDVATDTLLYIMFTWKVRPYPSQVAV